jgi:hypothetical protein
MSKPLTQQSIRFLQLSQCEAGAVEDSIPHVCCARNDDSLILQPATDGGTTSALSTTTAAYDSDTIDENLDDSIVSQNTTGSGLLPDRSECGREFIENRIYSGQVSAIVGFFLNDDFFFSLRTRTERNFLGWRC